MLLARLSAPPAWWLAPDCSSFGFMASSVSRRTRSNVEGVPSAFVEHGNATGSFVALAVLAATALGIWVVVENPVNSMFFQLPAVLDALRQIGSRRVTVHLGKFGSSSYKPLWLEGTVPWLEQLPVLERISAVQ